MSVRCSDCGAVAGYGYEVGHKSSCPSLQRRARIGHDLSTVAKRNAFYSSEEYRNMTTAEKCTMQGDGFINDND